MRDYTNFDQYYDELVQDIYPQPPSEWHTEEMMHVIYKWIQPLGISMALDVGCGEGEAQEFFNKCGIAYRGVALGDDIENKVSTEVYPVDFNFLGFEFYDAFDLVFSRHSLEHSPMPMISLMEWWRVSKRWLCLVIPNPEYHTFVGRNHYSVMNAPQTAWLLRRAGWKLNKVNITYKEFWFLCTKAPRISCEGWVNPPIPPRLYEFERDLFKKSGEIDVIKYFQEREWNGIF